MDQGLYVKLIELYERNSVHSADIRFFAQAIVDELSEYLEENNLEIVPIVGA